MMETSMSYEVAFDDHFMLPQGTRPQVVVFKTDSLEEAFRDRHRRELQSRNKLRQHGGELPAEPIFYIVAVIQHTVRKRISE